MHRVPRRVAHNGAPLREGVVEAFSVDPQLRRRGMGTALQIKAGYVLHPSHENDSSYFLLRP